MSKPLSEYKAKQREWYEKKRAEREAVGLCNRCGRAVAQSGKKLCGDCADRSRRQHKESYDVKLATIISYLGGRCSDCKQTFPACVYDVHHSNPKDKKWHMAGNNVFLPWEKLKPELDKCILLCANCHRIRHSQEGYGR